MEKQFKCPSCGWVQKSSRMPYDFRCPVCHTDGQLFDEMKENEDMGNNTDKDMISTAKSFSKKTLTLEECKEYIRNIKDLEISCYQLERLRDGLEKELRRAELRKRELSSEEIKKPIEGNAFTTLLGSIFVCFPYGAVPGLVIGFFKGLGTPSLFAKMFMWALLLGGAVSIIAFVFLFLASGGSKGNRKVNQKNLAEYEAAKQRHAHNTSSNNARLQVIPAEIQKCNEEYEKTKDLLRQYYNLNFIYPKYRGMVPVCTLYEYLESGRCFSLLGHEGAYNLYENELRMNLIIEKLDDIIYRLDDIQANQRMLANEIKRSNIMIDNLCRSVVNIEQNTELTQYYSKITATNTAYLAWLAYLDQKSVL